MKKVFTNVRLTDDDELHDIWVENGRIDKIVPAGRMSFSKNGCEEKDLSGKLVIPPYVESHIHLDYIYTMNPEVEAGTLFGAINQWSDTKKKLTVDDIKSKAYQGIKMELRHGVQFIRTHVDVTDPDMTALKALLEVRDEVKDVVELQLVAFSQEGYYAYKGGDELVEEALKMGCDVVGGIPHFEFSRELGEKSVKKAFELAEKYDRLIYIHCDETDDQDSKFSECIAAEAYYSGMGKRVTASHTCAMSSYNNAYAYKMMTKYRKSGINFVSCPSASVSLDGRFDNYPKRRGITRIRELTEAGLNCALGQDSISDPWYMPGTGNLLRVLEMGMHVEHMTGYKDMSHCLDFISTKGAKNLCIEDHYGIEEGKPASFIILDGHDDYEVFRFQSAVMLSVHNGNLVSHKIPAAAEVTF